MKRTLIRAAALFVCAAVSLPLAGCGSASSAGSSSSASSAPAVQASFGSYTDFDYANFTYDKGQDEKGFWQGVTAADFVTLPEDYAAIPMDAADVTPTDEDVQEQLNSLLAQYSTTRQVTDRAAADGDTVNIDYKGTVDGVAFTGGEASGFDLKLGSGSFISGFEEQIVGHTPGETFDITVTFPDGYHDSSDSEGNVIVMSGAEAVFAITLNYISETVLPELTDEWVSENLQEQYGVANAGEVDAMVRKDLLYNNQANHLYNYLMEKAVFGEIPAVVLDYEVCACLNYYAQYAGYYNMDLESFVTSQIGYGSVDELLAEAEEAILYYCKEDLLYQALAEKLDVAVTEDDLAAYSEYIPTYGQNYVARQALTNLVVDRLIQGATAVTE